MYKKLGVFVLVFIVIVISPSLSLGQPQQDIWFDDFETGGFTKWDLTYDVPEIVSYDSHSGSYAVELEGGYEETYKQGSQRHDAIIKYFPYTPQRATVEAWVKVTQWSQSLSDICFIFINTIHGMPYREWTDRIGRFHMYSETGGYYWTKDTPLSARLRFSHNLPMHRWVHLKLTYDSSNGGVVRYYENNILRLTIENFGTEINGFCLLAKGCCGPIKFLVDDISYSIEEAQPNNIAAIFRSASSRYSLWCSNIEKLLTKHGFVVITYLDDRFVGQWSNIDNFINSLESVPKRVLIFFGHGNKAMWFEEFDSRQAATSRRSELQERYGLGFDMTYNDLISKYYLGIGIATLRRIIQNRNIKLTPTFVFLGSCESAEVAETFYDLGAQCTVGFDTDVAIYTVPWGTDIGKAFHSFLQALLGDPDIRGEPLTFKECCDRVTKPCSDPYCTGHADYLCYCRGKDAKLISPEMAKSISIIAFSPVDLIITTPSGQVIQKGSSEYREIDIDLDGNVDDVIVIQEREIGSYSITVIPQGNDGDYLIQVANPGCPVIFFRGNTAQIPAQPYIIESTEEGIRKKEAIQGDLDHDGDIDQNDLNILLTYRNQPASECPECDIDGDGIITVLDARKLVLLCTRPRCACE